MRTSNPALRADTFTKIAPAARTEQAMTINGTVNKTAFMLVLLILAASWVWRQFYNAWDPSRIMPWLAIGGIGGFITALVTIFNPRAARISAPLYAVLEGLLLGGLSAIFERQFPGIVIQAVALTFGTLFCLLLAYRSGLIKVTENFRLGIVAATGAIALIYIVTIILGFFRIRMPFIHESGIFGIGFSLFVVTIAALNLVLDFDFIEKGAAAGAPKYMEWYGAFGLMVTLIWLYLEILRLLAKMRSRR
jgi:uncharacterized YccA/Bax inhibitor family protein